MVMRQARLPVFGRASVAPWTATARSSNTAATAPLWAASQPDMAQGGSADLSCRVNQPLPAR
jgi:hypothetical protein